MSWCDCAQVNKWTFTGVAAGGGALSAGYAIYAYTSANYPGAVICTIVAIAAEVAAGAVYKFAPQRRLENDAVQLDTTTSKLADAFKTAEGEQLTLDEAIRRLNSLGQSEDGFVIQLKTLFKQVQDNMTSLKSVNKDLNDLNIQYKGLIQQFLGIIEQIDKDNSGLNGVLSKVTAQFKSIIGMENALSSDADVERGLGSKLAAEKNVLGSLDADILSLLAQAKDSLVQRGRQLAQLQKEIDQFKAQNQTLQTENTQLQGQLPKIEEERRQLALEQQKLDQTKHQIEEKLEELARAQAHAS